MFKSNSEFELGDSPQDGISSVVFSLEDPTKLLASSWDRTVRLYDVLNNDAILVWNHRGPLLDTCFMGETKCIGVGLEKLVRSKDIESGIEDVIGEHIEAISCVKYSKPRNTLITGSWDSTISVWDYRTSKHVIKQEAPGKVYTLDTVGEKLVYVTSGQMICVNDMRYMKEKAESKETTLKSITRKVKCMPNGEGYVIGSVEGKILVDYFGNGAEDPQKQRYVFKCHRNVIDDLEYIYPVNAIEFFPTSGTFASGGSDGIINVWDIKNKKRIKQYHKINNEIASISVNSDSTLLAFAASYVYDSGETVKLPDIIHIFTLAPSDYRSKSRSSEDKLEKTANVH